jgi:hypothetical protein
MGRSKSCCDEKSHSEGVSSKAKWIHSICLKKMDKRHGELANLPYRWQVGLVKPFTEQKHFVLQSKGNNWTWASVEGIKIWRVF